MIAKKGVIWANNVGDPITPEEIKAAKNKITVGTTLLGGVVTGVHKYIFVVKKQRGENEVRISMRWVEAAQALREGGSWPNITMD